LWDDLRSNRVMTSGDQWEQVQQIFLAVADLTPDKQAALLDEMCEGDTALRDEVESLLRADSTGEATFGAAVKTALKKEAASLLDGPRIEGSRLGAYRLIREIGRGGMGSVYLASRADQEYESNVAIKLVRPGFDTDFVLRRFRRERQILARLHHPNIGRLFDGGSTEKQIPYLVMEYVQGSRITKYAADHRLGVEDRIRLFLPVCSAVEYAHRAFIVHRDLKPGNILVDATGTPKLLDFGISKLLHSQPLDPADAHDVVMATPDYASPEQIVGDPVTPASDIYSLGAVLYELLTGARPHRIEKATPLAIERAICLEPIIPPRQAVGRNSALAKRLGGDLDSIILRAMQKDPDQRYTSAEHLAEDLRRSLEHRPVTARPHTPGYRAERFIRRNRVLVVLTSAATAAVIALVGLAAYQARASRQQVLALERELVEAYGRFAELQGNTAEAARAYSTMVEISKDLWQADPSDPRALTNYGAAQLGLGMAIPVESRVEKRAALERARDWLTEAVRRNAANTQLRTQLDTATAALAALDEGDASR
jgi:eukaryotic-like serine/threonine-protein kinase